MPTLIAFWLTARKEAAEFGAWVRGGGWKALILGLVAVLSALAAGVVVMDHYRAKAAESAVQAADKRTEIITQARQADDHATLSAAAAKADITTDEDVKLANVQAANAAHEDWANQPIPDDVLNSLRD